MIDTTFLAVLRAMLYLVLIFLIVFDFPAIPNLYHRILLIALLLWLGILFTSSVFLLFGFNEVYTDMRDFGSTSALVLVVLAHIYWLNRRGE